MEQGEYGKYLFLRKLAAGGMGEVYLAKRVGPEGFERLVAIKRLLPQFGSDSRFVSIFLNEARLAAQLRHPNITQIFDLGKVDDSFFICMEYVDGPNLREFIRTYQRQGEALPVGAAVWIAARIFSALDYAHERAESEGRPLGVIHQDISPPNILMSREGEVKMTDFGLARAAIWGQETTRGILRGKFPYMSPEHVAGEPQDKRSDIYAAGVILYELLTGVTPFRETGSPLKLLSDIQSRPPPDPSRLRPDIPGEVLDLLQALLAKKPSERPARAVDALGVLESLPACRSFSERELARVLLERLPVAHRALESREATHRAPAPLRQAAGSARGEASLRGLRGRVGGAPRGFQDRPASVIPSRRVSAILALLLLVGLGAAGYLLVRGRASQKISQPAAWVPGSAPAGRAGPAGAASVSGTRSAISDSGLSNPAAPPARAAAALTAAASPATVTVEFTPSPLEISWDGVKHTSASPFVLQEVDPSAPHVVSLGAAGYRNEEGRIALGPGENRVLRFHLAPLPALVDVVSRPAGARVWLDGKPTGLRTPVSGLNVTANRRCEIRLERDGYAPWKSTLNPGPGAREAVEARLDSLLGSLRVDSTPWTEVYLDGEHLGRTPFLSEKIPVGEHTLTLVNKERVLEHRESVQIRQGAGVKKRFSFSGTLEFSGVPAGREIYLDGNLLGTAPIAERSLPVGTYELTVRDPGSSTEERLSVRVDAGQTAGLRSPASPR